MFPGGSPPPHPKSREETHGRANRRGGDRRAQTRSVRGPGRRRLSVALRPAGEHLHPRDDAPARRRASSRRASTTRCHVHRAHRRGREVLLRRRQHQHAADVGPVLQVLLLPARQRDAEPPRADAQAGHRGAQRPHRRRRPRDRHGRRPAHRPQGRRQGRPARGQPRRPARHRRHAAPRAARRQEPGDRADGHRPAAHLRRGARATASSTRSSRATTSWTRCTPTRAQFCPPNKAAKAVGRIKRAVQSGAEVPFESGLAMERELQQQLFESPDAREGLDAYVEKRKPQFLGR